MPEVLDTQSSFEKFAAQYDLPDSILSEIEEESSQAPESLDSEAPESTEVSEDSTEIQDNSGEQEVAETSQEGEPSPQAETLSGFDVSLLDQASRSGFSIEEAQAFGSPQALQRALAILDAKAVEAMRKIAPPSEAKPETKPESEAEKLLRLSEEDIDESVAKAHNSVVDEVTTLRKEIAELKADRESFQHVRQQLETQRVREYEQMMDGVFDGLSKDFAGEFGKGPISKLPEGSSAKKQRIAAVDMMTAIYEADQRAGRPAAKVEEYARRAAQVLFPDKIKTTARREVQAQIDARKKTSIAKPTSRNGKPVTGLEAAASYAERFFREHGIEDSGEGFEA